MGRLTSLPSAVITDDSALGGAIIQNSLRFNDNDTAYLNRTPSSAGNRRTFTFSCWCRRSSIGSSHNFLISSSGNGEFFKFGFRDDGRFEINTTDSGSDSAQLISTPRFRDVNGWYHIVVAFDTTQGTSTNRVKFYVNGTQITNFDTGTYPSQNALSSVNDNVQHQIGNQVGTTRYFDGYMAEVNLIDGFQLDPTYFGFTEFQTGIWKPKGYFGSYGTNGFRLDFSDNSATTAVTLGKDRSGQGNDFTPNNFSVSAGVNNDSFLESPTAKKEFATLNSNLQLGNSSTEYRQGNLTFYTSGSATVQTRANMSRNSGKWYAEFTLTTFTIRGGSYPYLGVAPAENFENTWTGSSGTAYQSQGGIWRNSSNIESGYATYAAGDVISVAINLDLATPQIWWAKNGTYIRHATANPATGLYGVNIEPVSHTGTYTFTASLYANPGQWDVNFGQRPFAHSIPTGFKSLNTDNFPINTPSIIRAQKHFAAVIYSGDNTEYRKIPLDFKADLLWFKQRNGTNSHVLSDSVTGIRKHLTPNSTAAQTIPGYPYVSSVQDDGIILRGSTNSGGNISGRNMVAWCWQAGTPKVPTNGSIQLDGSADHIIVGGHSDLDFGTGNFTIEGFFNTDKNTNSTIIASRNYYTAGTDGNWLFRISNASQLGFATYDGTSNEEYSQFSFTVRRGRWYHFAVVREGTGSNQLKIYIDGTSVGAMTVSKSLSAGSTDIGIGEDLSGTNSEFQGFISNIRIIKGTALYTSNFTPPTSPLTNVTNTKLLCCQSTTSAIAAAVAPASITAQGSARADTKNPFDAYSVDGVGYPSTTAAGITDGSATLDGASVNRKVGFSIVSWTGNSTGSTTIGHGLNQKPDIIILKNTSATENWRVYYTFADGTHDFTYLNTSGQANHSGYAVPTTTVFNKADTDNVNMVAYVWHSVPGYSKMGGYKGNGSTDGTFVPCGFRPAFVLTKINNTMNENWTISDSSRSPSNPVDLFLRSDETSADSTGAAEMDFLSNGFKLRNTDDKTNRSGATYIFMAFAEQTSISPYHTDTNAR